MFANYPSRKNVSHTRANRCRNASAVGLPAAPVSITSQEAASSGLLWASSRKTCLFHEECSGGCSRGWGQCPSGLAGLYVSLTPLFLTLLSFPLLSLLCLSVSHPEHGQFLPHFSPGSCPASASSFQSEASLLYPFPLSPSFSPSSSQTWFYWIGRGEVLRPLVESSYTSSTLSSCIHWFNKFYWGCTDGFHF